MRSTLNIDESMVRELMKATGAVSKTEAIHLAMQEAIRLRKLKKLKALAGNIHIDPVWRTQREGERKRRSHG